MSTSISIHGVKKVNIEKIDNLESDGKQFYTRDIIITDLKGVETKITLFADTKENVSI